MSAAPVARFALAVAGGRITGHAAPAGGPDPCVVRLEADGAPIAIARAAGFSAAAAGVRLGWCGVTLAGLDLAAALADTAQIRCHASGRLLLEVPLAPPPRRRATPPACTVEALRDRLRAADLCGDIEHILPFAFATLRRAGLSALVDASYRTLLRRPPEAPALARWHAAPTLDPVRALLHTILTSDEYRVAGGIIPGPFHPAFAFDLAALDD